MIARFLDRLSTNSLAMILASLLVLAVAAILVAAFLR